MLNTEFCCLSLFVYALQLSQWHLGNSALSDPDFRFFFELYFIKYLGSVLS